MKQALCLIALLAISCAPTEDRSDLLRRPLSSATESGWARLPLDSQAQEHSGELWISDAEGNPVPHLVEKDGLWEPRRLDMEKLLIGKNAEGRSTAEFALKFPEGWQVREREHLRVELDLEGRAPWVCAVKVERRLEGSANISLDERVPPHVYDLGHSEKSGSFSVPWDARVYRLTLLPAQGEAPRIRGVAVTALTKPGCMDEDVAVTPREFMRLSKPGEVWRATLGGKERVAGLEIGLKPPVAPIKPTVTIPSGKETESYVHVSGLLWNLPALNTVSKRVGVHPTLTDTLDIHLPEGARMDYVKALVKRDVLLFPAEANASYYLHSGGVPKRAPGNLAALPGSSKAVYARKPLSIGLAEADPHGVPRRVEAVDRAAQKSRPLLPWISGAVVLALAYAAWKLLKDQKA